MKKEPNYRDGVDAVIPVQLALGRNRPGTTHHGRWALTEWRTH